MVEAAPTQTPGVLFVTGRFKKFDAITGKCEIELNLNTADRHSIVELGGTLLRLSIESAQPRLPLLEIVEPELHPFQSEPVFEDGLVVGSQCAVCGGQPEGHTPMQDHFYSAKTPKADGVILDSCFSCDLPLTFHYSATDHVWEEVTSVRNGDLVVKCSRCDLPRGVHPETLPDVPEPGEEEGGESLAA